MAHTDSNLYCLFDCIDFSKPVNEVLWISIKRKRKGGGNPHEICLNSLLQESELGSLEGVISVSWWL